MISDISGLVGFWEVKGWAFLSLVLPPLLRAHSLSLSLSLSLSSSMCVGLRKGLGFARDLLDAEVRSSVGLCST